MMQGTKISFLVLNIAGGGAERAIVNLANHFVNNGIAVDFLLIEGNRDSEYLISNKVRIFKFDRFGTYLSILPLLNYIIREKPSKIYSILDLANIFNLVARAILGSKYQAYVGIQNFTSKHIRSPFKKFVERILLRMLAPFAETIIAVSEGVANDLSDYISIPRSKIQVVYNPILTSEIGKLAAKRNNHPWLQNKSSPVILSIGRLNAQKDFQTLIRAFNLLNKERNARLIILGEGEKRDEIDRQIADLELQNLIDMPGFVINPFNYYKNCDVFVLSSIYEGLPSVLLEALSIGCPIVSTDCSSGPDEILEGGKYGELVPVGDYNAISEAIMYVLDGNIKKADQEWRDRFSIATVMVKYLALFGFPPSE